MRRMLLTLLLIAGGASAQTAPSLAGTWTVDLSAKPGQPYTKPMNLTLNPDGTVTGSF